MSPSFSKSLCRNFWMGIAFALMLPAGAYAQAPTSDAGAAPNPNQAQVQPPSLLAKFDATVDSKSVKIGTPVSARTTKELKLLDLDVPKGSRLVGAVTSVKSMHDGNGDSMLGVRFDRVELKGDKILRIQGLIVAIGPASTNEPGLGYNSVLGRGGVGSTPGLDPSTGADNYFKDKTELSKGSTLEGIALAVHFDADGATLIRGVHRDIKLNSDVMVRVALFRSK